MATSRVSAVSEMAASLQVKQVILAELFGPGRVERRDTFTHALARVELDAMALRVVETQRLDASEAFERPRQAHRRIVPAGKQDERGLRIV